MKVNKKLNVKSMNGIKTMIIDRKYYKVPACSHIISLNPLRICGIKCRNWYIFDKHKKKHEKEDDEKYIMLSLKGE